MKLIPLTQGQFAMVDDEDFDWLNQWKWHAKKHRNTYYALRTERIRNSKKKLRFTLHRVVLGLTDTDILGDHKNRNGLDNQRSNLRTATRSENQKNRNPHGSSKYLGVSWSKEKNKWVAQIKHANKTCLGRFKTEEEAALAYNEAAKKYHGEFANLNIVD